MNERYINARDVGVSGSEYKTLALSSEGSEYFKLDNVGDFSVGDEVLVIGADPHIEAAVLFERKDMRVKNRRPWTHNQPIGDRVLFDGYDGTSGDFVVYFIDMAPEMNNTFRWSKDFGITWQENIPITEGWINIDGDVRIKINEFRERQWGCTAAFACSSRMNATVMELNGDTVKLSAPATRSAKCELMHSDTASLQRAIDMAIAEKKTLFIPNGKYRITSLLRINEPCGLTIEGESGTDTVIDNSLGAVGVERPEGSCFYINGGSDLTIKNLLMVGCYGFDERKRGANLFCKGGTAVYGFYFMKSNACYIANTKRVLFENCHARKMSAECFYSCGASRERAEPADNYTRSITYLDCSVEDCARNAFNNNDKAEGTSILYCRIKDIGNAAWEGASRFVKIHGCYISNTGAIAIGNIRHRLDMYNKLGTAQHIITDNYFEGGTSSPNMPMIKVGSFASQVVIKGNVFVNFASCAIEVRGEGQAVDTPPEGVIISSNSIDLTSVGKESEKRYGIRISSNFVTASDNHIFVRGEDENVTGIIISDDATRINIHDNTLAGLGTAITSESVEGCVGDVESDTVFYRQEGLSSVALKPMLLRVGSHRYRGWKLRWEEDGTESEILDFDPIELFFTLKEPRKMKDGDKFSIYPPNVPSWSIHHNIIDSCKENIKFESTAARRVTVDQNLF